MSLRLEGRKVLVTGAGRGIGKAVAQRFAREGAYVAVVTRGEQSGQETVDDIRQAGGQAELFASDVGRREMIDRVVPEVAARLGGLDVVVQNAASVGPMALAALDHDALDTVVDINLKSAFWLIAAALPYLERSLAARFLCVSSITGTRISNANYSVYGATKAGINGFIRQAAAELGSTGIRVNGVEPGITMTDSVAGYLGEQEARIAGGMPLRRVTRPDDIAAALLFLASDDAAQITGQTIIVDGGQSLGSTELGSDKD